MAVYFHKVAVGQDQGNAKLLSRPSAGMVWCRTFENKLVLPAANGPTNRTVRVDLLEDLTPILTLCLLRCCDIWATARKTSSTHRDTKILMYDKELAFGIPNSASLREATCGGCCDSISVRRRKSAREDQLSTMALAGTRGSVMNVWKVLWFKYPIQIAGGLSL